jgi:hypothetical protein
VAGYEDVKSRVLETQGVYVTTMEELKKAHGATKLGVLIREAISNRLKGHGLGHIPAELPSYQTDEVRLYQLGTALGNVIEAVLNPSAPGDQILLQVVDTDAQETLAQIRQLVCG